ncbi:MAG: YCF48-related protein [Chitinophagales bacterium]
MKSSFLFFRKISLACILLLLSNMVLHAQNGYYLRSPLPIYNDVASASFISEEEGWFGYKGGSLMHTIDGGDTWEDQTFLTEETTISSLFFANADTGFLLSSFQFGSFNYLYKTVNGGAAWNLITNLPVGGIFKSLNFINGKIGYVGGAENIILKTINGGSTWISQLTPEDDYINDLYFADAINGWAVGTNGNIFHTNNGGTNWELQYEQNNINFTGVSFGDALHGVACGYLQSSSKGRIFKTNDGGITWTSIYNYNADKILDIKVNENGEGIALARNSSSVIYTHDGGNTWGSAAVDFYAPQVVAGKQGFFVGGNAGHLYRNDSSVTAFTKIDQRISEDPFYDVVFADQQHGFITTYTGLLKTTDAGVTWSVDTSITGPIGDLQFTDPQHGYFEKITYPGPVETFYKTTDGGNTWGQVSTVAGGYSPVFVRDSLTAFAFLNTLSGGYGNIYRSTDGLQTWQAVLDSVPEIYDYCFVNDQTGWATGFTFYSGRTIYKTSDGGATWVLNYQSPDINTTASCITFIDPLHGFLGTNNGMYLETINGGDSWNEVQYDTASTAWQDYILDIEFMDATNGFMWAPPHVMHTKDGGQSWQTEYTAAQYASISHVAFVDTARAWLVGLYNVLIEKNTFQIPIGASSISESQVNWNVFPNPARDAVILSGETKAGNLLSVGLTNLSGQSMYATSFNAINNFFQFTLDLSPYTPGIYFLAISSETTYEVRKLILEK